MTVREHLGGCIQWMLRLSLSEVVIEQLTWVQGVTQKESEVGF